MLKRVKSSELLTGTFRKREQRMQKPRHSFMKKHMPKIVYFFVLISFIIPIITIVVLIICGETSENKIGYHSRADYLLMLVECALGLIVIHVPAILEKQLKFELPTPLYILYLIFLYCAITLGEVRSFYYLIPHWDVFLHAFSSMMTGMFGYMLITVINRDERILVRLSPLFVAVFAFCFSATIGSLWEIYEFTFDGIMGLNMQKYALADGTMLSGHAALADTMKDIIVDVLGALIASVIGYFSQRSNKHWMKISLKQNNTEQSKSRSLTQPKE